MNVWADVRFDHAAAADAIAACDAAATTVDVALDALDGRRSDVADFRGRRRDEFDAEEARIVRELAAVVREAQAVANAIESGADAATAEQQWRERRREELREEARRRPAPTPGQDVPW